MSTEIFKASEREEALVRRIREIPRGKVEVVVQGGEIQAAKAEETIDLPKPVRCKEGGFDPMNPPTK